ncbi:MAG: DUF5686 family protein [Bacteroidota bacterium]
MKLNLYKKPKALALLLVHFPLFLYSQNVRYSPDTLQATQTDAGLGTRVPQLLFSGISHSGASEHTRWYFPGALTQIQFNTVEGLVFNPAASYTRQLRAGKFINLKPSVRYGVGNQRLNAHLEALYFYNPKQFAYAKLAGGRAMQQINDVSSLDGWGNTFNTLLYRRNFLKLYEATFLHLTHVSSPYKDVLFTTALHWEDRMPLQNLPRIDDSSGRFTPNAPENVQLSDTRFPSHQAFLWHAQLTWQTDQGYTRRHGKFVPTSQAPAVTLAFTTTLSPLLGSDLSYQKLSLSIKDHYQVVSLGQGRVWVEAGDFLSQDSLSFVDYHHYNGNLSIYNTFDLNGFQLLDYYYYSNADFYVQGHLQHTFQPISLGKKPITVDPVVSAHYLYTDDVNYLELGVGAEKVLKNWRVEGYASFHDGKFDRLGFRFGFSM